MTARNTDCSTSARRLTRYLVAGAGALGAAGSAQSAVIYTPGPFVANNSTINIDFDGAGGAEFTITHATGTVPGSKPSKPPKNFNRLGMANGGGATSLGVVGSASKPARLGSGVLISSLNVFGNLAGPFQSMNLASGPVANWNGGQTGFIGVRFNLGGGPLYGWIQLQTPASGLSLNTGEVLGYAYETSGGGIAAGDTGSAAVPEPNTLLLLASGALGVLALKRRKRQ